MPQNHILVRTVEGTPMESHPYTKPRGVGPVTTQLTPGAESASCPLHRSSQAHPAQGPVHQHAERGANPLCHLLQIQPARVRAVLAARAIIIGPHPPPFYTSSLTSPWRDICERICA